MPDIIEKAEKGELQKDTAYILYCMKGMQSIDKAMQLRSLGYDVVSLQNGYSGWLMSSFAETPEAKTAEEAAHRKKAMSQTSPYTDRQKRKHP